MNAATKKTVPAKTLAALPARQHSFSAADTIADSLCSLLINESIPNSTDPEFSRKASEIVGLYLNPPENAIVLSVDEKPSIQALERAQGYIRLPNGRVVSGFAQEYERHGTTTLFAALETATGLVKAGHYKRRRRRGFLDFMNGEI